MLAALSSEMPASVYVPSPLERVDDSVREVKSAAQARITEDDDSTLRTVDSLVRRRAALHPAEHAVSYPVSGTTFADYTIQELDVFAWRVAKHYESKVPVRKISAEKPAVVALLGPSNLEYLVAMLALSKLGHTALLVSTRIPQIAVESLMKVTGAETLVADVRYSEMAAGVQQTLPATQLLEVAGRQVFEFPVEAHGDTRLDSGLDPEIEKEHIAFVIHSSGSTGLPKPIYQTHKSCLANYASSMNMKAFITLPLFHNHGICNLYRSIYSRTSIHLYNADLPLTQDYLVRIMREQSFEIFYGVPYALKLLSESNEGVELLRQLKIVMYGGSACPDDLGNTLVDSGVNLVGHYGATEVGQLMTSFRPEGDKAWNYVREHEKLMPYLRWIPRGPNLYECSVTDGWPSKVQSNQPDGSYTTKDLFEPHPSIPKAWKYIARLDDTLVLVNGEKFNPVAMEGSIRSNKNVAEAVVFGAGRPYLGILVVPAAHLAGRSNETILDAVWPVIESANQAADAFGRISKRMVRLLPTDCAYPRTDKGSIIRQAFYKAFQAEMEEAYDSEDASAANVRQFNEPELREFLRDLLSRTLPTKHSAEDDTDFFLLGLDSLQAIQMRSEILKTVDIGGKRLGQNVVFEQPSIEKLTQYLLRLRLGQGASSKLSVESEMESLISKYTKLDFSPNSPALSSVVVTGATGSLGAHVIAKLATDPSIAKIYCLVRATDTKQGARRMKDSLLQRRLYHTLPLPFRQKMVALPSDLADLKLGLSEQRYRTVTRNLRAVIHCAWSVNFNMHLTSFEKSNIAGVAHLLALCRAAGRASMNFCSSVSTCARATTLPVPEAAPDLAWAQGMGYAQSKSVAEHVCARAADRGVTARVLRVGQIVGDARHGVWNAQEAVPMLMRTALTVGALPRLRETPSWLLVDTVADAVAEISLSDAGSVFANVTNPRMFSWTEDLLPALRAAGLAFEEVEPKEWVRRLRASNQDPTANPPIKLVDFFASKYDKESFEPSKPFVTDNACSLSPALANAPVLDQGLVNSFVNFFLSNSWKPASPTGPQKAAVLIAGPCGTGKSSVGSAIAAWLGVPFIEGDSLHSRQAVDKMRSNSALSDDDREDWLGRICSHAGESLFDLGYDSTVVSCSALKGAYRFKIRHSLAAKGVKAVFVDLQASRDALVQRLEQRVGHYMSAAMVEGQLDLHEDAAWDELDVLPVDAEDELQVVIEEAKWLLDRSLGLGKH